MKKFFYLLLLIFVLVSCGKEISEINEEENLSDETLSTENNVSLDEHEKNNIKENVETIVVKDDEKNVVETNNEEIKSEEKNIVIVEPKIPVEPKKLIEQKKPVINTIKTENSKVENNTNKTEDIKKEEVKQQNDTAVSCTGESCYMDSYTGASPATH